MSEAERLRATVVGGGIAGLAGAASLLRAGWQVTVLEQAPAFGEVGAGVAVTANGMRALAAVGAGDEVRTAGYQVRTAGFQDRTGRWVLRVPETSRDEAVTTWLWSVHRQRLHAALLHAAAGADLVTGARVVSVEPGVPGGAPATVTWGGEAGERAIESDLVVAADGVRSTVRAQLFPGVRPQYGGSTSWRAVITDAEWIDDRFIAAWGAGTEFGALRVSPTEVYWYGYFRHPAGARFVDELAAARDRFANWPRWVTDTVRATGPEQLMRHDVYHLPHGVPNYASGRVVLIGDAAHAFLPTVGQGAASSLEDGVSLGPFVGAPVAAGADLRQALSAFDQARRPRCHRIAREAVMVARLGADLGGGWRQSLRNNVLRVLPAGSLVRAGARITDWAPPTPLPPPAG